LKPLSLEHIFIHKESDLTFFLNTGRIYETSLSLSLSFLLALAPSYTFQGKVEEKRYTYIVEDFRFSINEVCRLVRIIFPREIACFCCEGVFTTSTLLTLLSKTPPTSPLEPQPPGYPRLASPHPFLFTSEDLSKAFLLPPFHLFAFRQR